MQYLTVHSVLNKPIDSNCYIVSVSGGSDVILIDPALEKGEELAQYIEDHKFRVAYILLTHEHFDHISSVELIRNKHCCPVIASVACSVAITDSKKNLSLFRDQIGFCCRPADIVIDQSGESIAWNGVDIVFYLTPGHSRGGLSFYIDPYLFTGDTWMEGLESPTKLPGGSKKQLEESLQLLKSVGFTHTTIYPGHGRPFQPFAET